MPGDLGYRVRILQQPGPVGAATVVQERVRERYQRELAFGRSGGRSATAVQALTEAGYRAVNVAGGTLAWTDAGNPTSEGSAP